MLGVDLYTRYQQVTDWRAVRDAGVRFCYVKGTDGGGRAVAPADALVRGARSVGIPVGLYHYAQLTPAPEMQADVLHAEVRRLDATGLPPALDFESTVANTLTAAAGAQFCRRFIARLREHGHRRVTLYANTSHLAKLNPDSWDDPNLLIWAARYGTNDGVTYPGLGSYAGRVDIHQWTDKGRLPGITSAGLDLNRALTNILQEDDMSWTAPLTLPSPGDRTYTETHTPAEALGDTFFRVADMYGWLKDALPVLLAGTDPQRVADALAPTVAAAVQAAVDEHDGVDLAPEVRDDLAAAVVRQLGARLAA